MGDEQIQRTVGVTKVANGYRVQANYPIAQNFIDGEPQPHPFFGKATVEAKEFVFYSVDEVLMFMKDYLDREVLEPHQ